MSSNRMRVKTMHRVICAGFSVFVYFVCFVVNSSAAEPVKKTTYDEHVLPILRDSCINCHGPDKKRGGLAIHNFTDLMQGGASGAVVKPGNPDGSRLFLLMTH